MKKIISALLSLVLISTLSVPACATALKSFSDVPTTYWAHGYIMRCVEEGVIAGTTAPDKNGVGTFSPNGTVTLGQFLTVVSRLVAPEKIQGDSSEHWAMPYYNAAVQSGIITSSDFEGTATSLNQSLSREDMAFILVGSAKASGVELQTQAGVESKIKDYTSISTNRRDCVKTAYSNGLLAGNELGQFSPKGTTTRAQMATVVCRLMDCINEVQVPVTGDSWIEGQAHSKDAVKPGATVIKADGTKVVLKETKVGDIYILGWKQGVDFVSGTVINGVEAGPGKRAWSGFNGSDMTVFIKDPISGEVHTEYEWSMVSLTTKPTYKGSYNGEIGNTYFEWDSNDEYWYWIGPGV